MWQCQSCGCQFPRIRGDEDVARCSKCVEVEALRAEVTRLRAALTEVAAFDHAEGDVYESLCDAVSVALDALTE